MTTGHGPWDELAAGHALNALEPEDEHAFLDHLRGCDRCRADLAAMQEVASGLAYAAEPADPPAGLRGRVLAAAAAERPPASGRTPSPAEAPRPRPPFRLATLATAAAVAAVLALGAWNVLLRADGTAKDDALARRTAALSCLAARDSATVRLTSDGAPRGTACLAGGKAFLVVDDLDPNDTSSSVYVLWWLDARSAAHAVGAFDVESATTGVYELQLDATPADVRAMAISLEPGRGLPDRPTRRIAYGEATTA